jgi:hypothetical protein
MSDDPGARYHTKTWLEVRPRGQAPARKNAPVLDWFMHEVLEPVLADLQHPRPIDIIVELEPRDDGALVWFSERGQSGGFGLGIPDPGTPRSVVRAAWADQLQEQFFPEAKGGWGEARPECPGHPHPAHAVERDGEAWWVCPIDSRPIAKLGQLH